MAGEVEETFEVRSALVRGCLSAPERPVRGLQVPRPLVNEG